MIVRLGQELAREGTPVPTAKLCRWFGLPRRTLYYRPVKSPPRIDADLARQIRAQIDANPTWGYRTVAHALGRNKNTVQRICQLKGWQVRRRPAGARPRVRTTPSVADAPNRRWATDQARVWTDSHRWLSVTFVIDCCTRELLGWNLSPKGDAKAAACALEHALIERCNDLGKAPHNLVLRSDNGLVFTSKYYTRLARQHGVTQEFITPRTPQQNGLVERFIRTFKQHCGYKGHFRSLAEAKSGIENWIRFYNHRRPHQALGMKTPAQACAALAA